MRDGPRRVRETHQVTPWQRVGAFHDPTKDGPLALPMSQIASLPGLWGIRAKSMAGRFGRHGGDRRILGGSEAEAIAMPIAHNRTNGTVFRQISRLLGRPGPVPIDGAEIGRRPL